MDRFPFRYFPAAFLIIAMAQTGCLSIHNSSEPVAQYGQTPADKQKMTCKFYPLPGVRDDTALAKWVADALPTVVQSGKWSACADSEKGTGTLSYCATTKMLMVCHTPAVHAEVAEFLKNLKQSLPQQQAEVLKVPPQKARYETSQYPKLAFDEPRKSDKTTRQAQATSPRDPNLMQATFATPNVLKAPDAVAVNKSTAYPIPAPLSQPKHLFHLVFRYEGDGVLDAAMTDAVKALSGGGKAKEDAEDKSKSEDAKSAASQLLHLILRYEGDGVVDSNVVDFMKAIGEYATRGQNGPAPQFLLQPMALPPGVPPPPPPANPSAEVNFLPAQPIPSAHWLGNIPQYLPSTTTAPIRMMPAADEPAPTQDP